MTRPNSLPSVDRREYLRAAGAATLGVAGLAGCVGQAAGTLATHVTDQPADIEDFESLVVTMDGMWLGPEGAESGADDQSAEDAEEDDADAEDAEADEEDADEEEDADDADDADDDDESNEASGRQYVEFDEPQQADLVELQDGSTQLVDERDLETGSFRFIQLDVTETEGTLVDGDEADIELPGEAPLTFNAPFEIREDTRTSFTADFAPVRRGRTETYLLRPVASGIEVQYE